MWSCRLGLIIICTLLHKTYCYFNVEDQCVSQGCAVLAGMDKETAQKEYIALVKSLAEKYAK